MTSRGVTGASGAVFVAELELLLRKIQLGLAMPKYVVISPAIIHVVRVVHVISPNYGYITKLWLFHVISTTLVGENKPQKKIHEN